MSSRAATNVIEKQLEEIGKIPNEEVVVVQRKYTRKSWRHEFTPITFGGIPFGTVRRTLFGGASYTLHANDWLGFQLFDFLYSKTFFSSFTDDINNNKDPGRNQADIKPDYQKLLYFISGGVQVTPFYGKLSTFSRWIAYVEPYFSLGAGMAKTESDSIGRFWQCGTIQLDFNFPERFQLEYMDSSSQPKRPVMIHRAIWGSLERFLGILVEHHAGHFPLWLSPVQAVIINVTDAQKEYAETVAKTLESWGLRIETDSRNEKLGYRIREAQLKKTPLMIVLGEKESSQKTLSVRKTTGETLNDLTLEGFKTFLEPQLNLGGTNH